MSDSDLPVEASQIGQRLRQARREADLTQEAAAELLGVNPMTVSKRERGERGISAADFEKVLAVYSAHRNGRAHKSGLLVPRGTEAVSEPKKPYGRPAAAEDDDSWSPNPALVHKIPRRAYDVAVAYCTRLRNGGWPREEIEQIERLMIDARYAQANKRKGHELSEDEHIMLIDATWEAVKHAASAMGREV